MANVKEFYIAAASQLRLLQTCPAREKLGARPFGLLFDRVTAASGSPIIYKRQIEALL
jgi:hypothetical protein